MSGLLEHHRHLLHLMATLTSELFRVGAEINVLAAELEAGALGENPARPVIGEPIAESGAVKNLRRSDGPEATAGVVTAALEETEPPTAAASVQPSTPLVNTGEPSDPSWSWSSSSSSSAP